MLSLVSYLHLRGCFVHTTIATSGGSARIHLHKLNFILSRFQRRHPRIDCLHDRCREKTVRKRAFLLVALLPTRRPIVWHLSLFMQR